VVAGSSSLAEGATVLLGEVEPLDGVAGDVQPPCVQEVMASGAQSDELIDIRAATP